MYKVIFPFYVFTLSNSFFVFLDYVTTLLLSQNKIMGDTTKGTT